MSDSDAEELSVGAPSPIRIVHDSYLSHVDGEDEGSSNISAASFRTRSDQNESANNENSASSAANQRHPTCALCKNHQTISTLKGHKRYCPWRTCLCELCYSTNKKRKINAEQVALRRAQAQDEELRKKGILQQLERLSEAVKGPPSQSSEANKIRPRLEPIKREDGPNSKLKSDPLSHARAIAIGCQSGPVVFGQQLSLGSILMGQNVSMLRESVCDTRLGFDMLTFLFRIIQDVKGEIEKVSFQLNEIHQEIQIKIHSGNLTFVPTSSMVFGQDVAGKGVPPNPVAIHHYPLSSSFQSQFRATVINGPYPHIPPPLYPN